MSEFDYLNKRITELEKEIERLSTVETFFRLLSTGEYYTSHGITIGTGGVGPVYLTDGQVLISATDTLVGGQLILQSTNTIPADDDVAGNIRFRARDDDAPTPGDPIVAEIYAKTTDVTAGSVNGAMIFVIQEDDTDRFTLTLIDANMGIHTETQFGGGRGVIGIQNALANPGSNPSGGGVLYSDGGALKWRGSSGTVTTIAAA